jgi:putative sigma-54 modulation protein
MRLHADAHFLGAAVALTVAPPIDYICRRRLSDVAAYGRQLRAAQCRGPSGGVAQTRKDARQELVLADRRLLSARSLLAQRLPMDKERAMQVTVSGRHMGVSDALKEYCTEKAGKLTRYYDRIQSVEVIIAGKDGIHRADIIVHADSAEPFVATETHADAYAAMDLILDKISRQLTRHKERLRNRKHPPRATPEPQ